MERISMKAARIYAGMTEKEASSALKIKPSTLNAWETGVRIPTHDHAAALAEVYGLTLNDISFSRTDNTGDDDTSKLFTSFRQMTESQRTMMLQIMDLVEGRPDRQQYAISYTGKVKDLPAALAAI